MRVVNSYIITLITCLFCVSTYSYATQPRLTSKVITFSGAPTANDYNFVVPNQGIDAAPTVDPGEVVVIKAGSVPSTQYLVGVTYRWLLYSNGKLHKHFQAMPDNQSIFFGAGIRPGRKFTVVLSASYLYVVRDSKDVNKVLAVAQRANVLTADIVVTGSPPDPNPGPGPGPGPGPAPTPVILPEGKYKLAQSTYDLVTTNVSNSANRVKGAQALAKSFRGMASAIAAGTVKTAKDLLTQTAQANRGALTSAGLAPAEWETFFARLQPVIYDLYSKNQVVALTDFATAWNEIAIGLEAVR